MIFLTIIFLPLLTFFLVAALGNFLGAAGAIRLSLANMALALALSCFCFFSYALQGVVIVIDGPVWLSVGLTQVSWGFSYDPLCAVMFLVVNSISFLVHLYSIEYMDGDPHRVRFFSYLSLFTFFMLFLVSASNLVQLFVGWEGVGLCSFLLIGFWFTRVQAGKSAFKAVLMNRFGDVALLFGIALLAWCVKTVNFFEFLSLAHFSASSTFFVLGLRFSLPEIVGLCFLVAAVGKSAQLGLHTWIPDAMEGPTPVSALIHAALW